jgi:hypothetical protein
MSLHLDERRLTGITVRDVHVAAQERVHTESAALAAVVRVEDDKDVFDCHHHEKTPDDNREDTEEVLTRGGFGKRRRIHVKGAGSYVAVDDSYGLVGEPEEHASFEDLVPRVSQPFLRRDSVR